MSEATELTSALGLDSLDYAELVVRLESAFGFDPFAEGVATEIRTVRDMAALYEAGAQGPTSSR
jgi:acyl carrier protein